MLDRAHCRRLALALCLLLLPSCGGAGLDGAGREMTPSRTLPFSSPAPATIRPTAMLAGRRSPAAREGTSARSPSPSPSGRDGPKALRDAPWSIARAPLPERAWDDPESYPTAARQPGLFWLPDEPEELPPLAFGVLPTEAQPRRLPAREYELAAPLTAGPAEAPVYLGGRYPASSQSVFEQLVRRGNPAWQFVPQYSSVFYRPPEPFGELAPVATAPEAAGRAAQALMGLGLLMPDATLSMATADPKGEWSVVFHRRVDGAAVYSKSDLTVTLNPAGQITSVLAHRRPLLSRSRYPLRSPEEAWRLLLTGRGRSLPVNLSLTGREGLGDRFVVTRVELAYVEAEPFLPRQVVQPYYVFRDASGVALYVPAVDDPYVEWWL